MAITIYTYSNPYEINKEPYFASIQNCFHLCVSQTLVNGLCDQYKEFYKGKLTTVTRFINELYSNWESDSVAISQRAAIDNLIEYMDFSMIVDDIGSEDVITSLKRNRSDVVESIRTMFELGMEPGNIKSEKLSYEQKFIVEIYRELKRTDNKFFAIKNGFKEDEIDSAIDTLIKDIANNAESDEIKNIRKDLIVIHGIHQFTPIMLRMIEELSKYKLVVILFNYQPDYKNVYQTWLNVYSSFEAKIVYSPRNLNNESQMFDGGKVADNIAAIIAGNTGVIDFSKQIEVTQFDNLTEFAGYIAKKFEQAESLRKEDNYAHSALYYMDEQFYAANSDVNDILKIYFPEQFGERAFLDYPIGHFFLSITNMWDPESKILCLKDFNDLYECLSCRIICEERHGELISILDRIRLFIDKETTIKGIIKRLKRLKDRIAEITDGEEENREFQRVEYFDVSISEIDKLIDGLNELNEITKYFYDDFNDAKNDFKSFYKKIGDVLVKKVLDVEEIDSEFKEIVERVLKRLDEVKDVEANASFDCLKETMQLYLQQIPGEGRGANWIVRNFEQIDGDVLRRNRSKIPKTYHFACLSDADMSITHKDEFSWPLDINFFEVAQAPVDWKYQVFVTSRMEYKNFRRYALVYGLAFSKCAIKLSYIKNERDGESELYYLLKILNAKITPYEPEADNRSRKKADYIQIDNFEMGKFDQYDLMRYRICKYRFLIESIVEEKTVYKDEFLLKKYLTIVLEHRARKYFKGKSFIRNIVFDYLNEQMDELRDKLLFVNHADAIDIVRTALAYLEKYSLYNGKFMLIGEKETDYMIKREIFLTAKLGKNASLDEREVFKNSTQSEVDSELSEKTLNEMSYRRNLNTLCVNCSEKDICLEIFKSKKCKGELL